MALAKSGFPCGVYMMDGGWCPHRGFTRAMTQFMLGSKWLVAPVVTEDDSVTVELPAGRWRDDLGAIHEGPKTMKLEKVPLARLPRFERLP